MEKKTVPAKSYVVFSTRTTLNQMHDIVGQEVGKLSAAIEKSLIKQTGPMEFIYLDCTSDMDKEFELEIAVPVEGALQVVPQGYQLKSHPEFACMSYTHKGAVDNLYAVYDQLFTQLWDNSIRPGNQVREVYTVFHDLLSDDNLTEIQIGI